jgi:hypothetical protein
VSEAIDAVLEMLRDLDLNTADREELARRLAAGELDPNTEMKIQE